ncbi:hypothetical protein ACFPRL_11320 [Pseudoclavibacter helvolus]
MTAAQNTPSPLVRTFATAIHAASHRQYVCRSARLPMISRLSNGTTTVTRAMKKRAGSQRRMSRVSRNTPAATRPAKTAHAAKTALLKYSSGTNSTIPAAKSLGRKCW